LIHAIVLGLSGTGDVFGMQTMVVNPPAAAARARLNRFLVAKPGLRKCTCMSIKPGATIKPFASISSTFDFGSLTSDFSAIRPSTI
jgi:hypothetical protein